MEKKLVMYLQRTTVQEKVVKIVAAAVAVVLEEELDAVGGSSSCS